LPSGLLLMAGHQEKMIELDIERVKHVRVTDISDSGCVVMRQHPRFVCLGDPNGKVCHIFCISKIILILILI